MAHEKNGAMDLLKVITISSRCTISVQYDKLNYTLLNFHSFYLQLTTLTTTTAAYYHRGIGNDLKAVIRTMKM